MSQFECSLCCERVPTRKAITCTINKNHKVCSSCVTEYFKTSTTERTANKKCLFDIKCSGHYTNVIIRALIPNSMYEQLKKQWKTSRLTSLASSQPGFQICPFCRKYGCQIDMTDDDFNSVNCTNCNKQWCTRCFGEVCLTTTSITHSCIKFNRELKIQNTNKRFIEQQVEAATTGVFFRTCPKCNVKYTRSGGCSIITCAVCGCNSCWLCEEEKIDEQHSKTSNWQKMHDIYTYSTNEYEKYYNIRVISTAADNYTTYVLQVIRIVYLLELNTDDFVRKTIIEKANQLRIFSKYITEYKS